MERKKYSRQQIQKKFHGKCFACGEDDYNILDAHRIIEGGPYIVSNIVVCCSNCHRKIHAKEIKIDRKYLSTNGMVLHWWLNEVEMWTDILN